MSHFSALLLTVEENQKRKRFSHAFAQQSMIFLFTILSPSLSFENERINDVVITLLSCHLSKARKLCFRCSLKATAAVDAVVRLFNSESSSSCEFIRKQLCVSFELEKLGSKRKINWGVNSVSSKQSHDAKLFFASKRHHNLKQ